MLKIAPEYGYTYTSIQTVVPPEKDSANLQCRAPSSFRRVVTQNVQTNAPKLVNVGVKILVRKRTWQMQLIATWGYASGAGGGGGGENKEQKIIDQGQLQSLLQLCA